jgi:hypothetical protein
VERVAGVLDDPEHVPREELDVEARVRLVAVEEDREPCEPGRKTPFSGRLKGAPFAAFARVFALKGAVPSTEVSWIVSHRVRKLEP